MQALFLSELSAFLSDSGLGQIRSIIRLSGGSINDAYRVETMQACFFLKTNSASTFPQMFVAEKRGLELLSSSGFIVPKPLIVTQIMSQQILILEWIEKGVPKAGFWDEFGRNLADMHSISNERFGLDHQNYIGSLPQHNSEHETWVDFYREERLIPQMKMAEQSGRLTLRMKSGFEHLFQKLETIFPTENPSLLHGDLWSGNLMVAANGSPSIYDPAVYFGHREMDLAMMALFGGFGEKWLHAYNETYPLENGWRERVPVGQLYPLMVHVNLFGGGYGNDVESILQRFM